MSVSHSHSKQNSCHDFAVQPVPEPTRRVAREAQQHTWGFHGGVWVGGVLHPPYTRKSGHSLGGRFWTSPVSGMVETVWLWENHYVQVDFWSPLCVIRTLEYMASQLPPRHPVVTVAVFLKGPGSSAGVQIFLLSLNGRTSWLRSSGEKRWVLQGEQATCVLWIAILLLHCWE